MLMDLIPLDATLVKGSHGRLPEDQLDWPVLAGDFANLPKTVNSTDVFNYLLQACRK
jgi:hypothetical protein